MLGRFAPVGARAAEAVEVLGPSQRLELGRFLLGRGAAMPQH